MGSNTKGVLAQTCEQSVVPMHIAQLSNIAHIATGAEHALAVDRTGRVYGWGSTEFGQIGVAPKHGSIKLPQVIPLQNQDIQKVFCGEFHSIFLTYDGKVKSCGKGDSG
jgi:regulator of chromosome condensation